MRVTVFGTGYLGATHAACMAELGHEVLGVDIDEGKIERLRRGEAPFYEPGLPEILLRQVEAGQLRFTTDYREAAEFADLHFIGVGTPQCKGEFAADTSHVEEVVARLAPLLTGDAVLVGKSTVPVGTAVRLQGIVDRGVREGVRAEVVWNPEFLREGFAVKDTLTPDRIVIGLAGGEAVRGLARDLVNEAYAPILESDPCPVVVTDLATAELVKVSANAFLATKISFINAVAEVCEAAGADVTVLADAIGMDPRIGRRFLNAGLGFGGGCLPKDIRAFMARAGELGADQAMTFLREVDSINMRQRQRMVELATEVCDGTVLGKTVAVLGAAFKPNSDDVRDSPALNVAGMLSLKGATTVVYDPQALDNARALFPTLAYAGSALEACEGADVVLVATEWAEFLKLEPTDVALVARGRILLDGRNCMPAEQWRQAGWTYRALGFAPHP
ncbi:UDP-glucose dehydrogenase family protein [Dietzia massiliensis]|uniref:UDP-glucose dehydrogenase family protein n=1 Tax=Dietzia massiliensis TaxID=2697499 RepID=UPI001BCD7295|nr:UDP-glucose/GDP-mannose dehydrogenase family protein [Dietzia massiliensis]MBS7548193.1 UDP-glucose/GDP-mannose dehydrogenase family protein [Dietzia massiliensis]